VKNVDDVSKVLEQIKSDAFAEWKKTLIKNGWAHRELDNAIDIKILSNPTVTKFLSSK